MKNLSPSPQYPGASKSLRWERKPNDFSSMARDTAKIPSRWSHSCWRSSDKSPSRCITLFPSCEIAKDDRAVSMPSNVDEQFREAHAVIKEEVTSFQPDIWHQTILPSPL